jgi:cysteine desulfurase
MHGRWNAEMTLRGVTVEPFVYLDHNATTPVRFEAAAAVADALAACGNPSSVHRAGREAKRRLEAARDKVARSLGLPAGGALIFTSGGTEANHLALKGSGRDRILRSTIEHDSVRAAAVGAIEVPVDCQGTIDLAALAALLAVDGEGALVSIMAANNETGVIQPLAEITRLAHERGALVHCDAIQAVGKIPFDMASLGVDLVSVSAHKLGGPPGIAALAVAPGVALSALQTGGGQEKGLRAGTENLPGVAGFAAAIEIAILELPIYARLAELRDAMERRLRMLEPAARVFGEARARLPNTSSIALPGVGSEVQVMALDLAGIGVSAGSACSSGKVRPSHVLEAMGAEPDLARSAIRISLGRDTAAADIDRLVSSWGDLARRTAHTRSAA